MPFPSNKETAIRLMSSYGLTPEVQDRVESVTRIMMRAAAEIAELMPEGPDAVVALRRLQEARMLAVFAISATVGDLGAR